MKSINKQKKYLSENLIVESLRQFGTNKEDVKCFEQALQGSRISDFLIDEAWQADINRDTKVFLVRDRNTREIAFYYALNCGILYKEYKHKDLTPKELELITAYVEAASRAHMNGLTAIDQEAANNLLTKALGDFYEFIEDSERATQLLALADDKVIIKEENAEAKEETGEGEFTKQVQETFPAMDIKFLCRNRNYKPGIELDFKLGIYVFWEIVVPHILKVADLVGCQYVYLFAADNSPGIEKKETEDSLPVMWSEDYDPYSDEEEDIEEDLENIVKGE